MSTSEALLTELPGPGRAWLPDSGERRRLDLSMLAGIVIALGATIAGIASTGVSLTYFLQPTGALIVLGGTLGVVFITTPWTALVRSVRRVFDLFRPLSGVDRDELIEEIVYYARIARTKGLYAIEPILGRTSNKFLEELLLLALDVKQRAQLQAALENKLRLCERQGEADAKVLEVAGGFAPTIGVLGTVVGLIDVMRQFSSVSSVVSGIGTAFVSTIYGLALANLVLLPAAHRIRARVAEAFETQELMMEGGLCVFDGIHPSLVRQRLGCFLHEREADQRQTEPRV